MLEAASARHTQDVQSVSAALVARNDTIYTTSQLLVAATRCASRDLVQPVRLLIETFGIDTCIVSSMHSHSFLAQAATADSLALWIAATIS